MKKFEKVLTVIIVIEGLIVVTLFLLMTNSGEDDFTTIVISIILIMIILSGPIFYILNKIKYINMGKQHDYHKETELTIKNDNTNEILIRKKKHILSGELINANDEKLYGKKDVQYFE
jgi:hypothetical protein